MQRKINDGKKEKKKKIEKKTKPNETHLDTDEAIKRGKITVRKK